jgi:hypothetical protein
MQVRKLVLALACAALALPAAAHGKGASQAKIEGDGLKGGAITLKSDSGEGDPPPGSKLARLAQDSGFFPAAFGQSPNPMEPSRPDGDLGPKYTVTYTMPGPNNELDELRQEIYPYAHGGPVTYMSPGQEFFGSMKTRGGWFRGYAGLKPLLIEIGVPASPPSGSTGSGYEVSWPAAGIAVLLVGILGAALIVVVRRRPGPLATR